MIALKIFAGIVIGGGAGFAYQRLVGCASGTCPLTSNATITTIYGAVVGLIFVLSK